MIFYRLSLSYEAFPIKEYSDAKSDPKTQFQTDFKVNAIKVDPDDGPIIEVITRPR